jgi:hypothetical protein
MLPGSRLLPMPRIGSLGCGMSDDPGPGHGPTGSWSAQESPVGEGIHETIGER